jgi:hypothetical protein
MSLLTEIETKLAEEGPGTILWGVEGIGLLFQIGMNRKVKNEIGTNLTIKNYFSKMKSKLI